jgi:transcription elongation factor GreB
MSKAFKGEDASEVPLVVPARAPLPPGEVNYVTLRGFAALQAERDRLLRERAQAEAAGISEEGARAIAVLSVRILAVNERIASARVVDPAAQPRDEVRFGAAVLARATDGTERRLKIVGVDEADASAGRIAFIAPLARAFLGCHVGDVARVRTPRGHDTWEVVAIDYEPGASA